jgi:predicted PurR-regulated permease PerM
VAAEHDAVNERRALGWLAFGAVAVILWLARPFATGLFLGALMAFIAHPLHERLARLTGRPTAVSVLMVLATATIIVGALVEFGSLFLARAVVLANLAREQMRPGGALADWVDAMTGWLARFGVSTESLTEGLRGGAGDIASWSAALAGSLASRTLVTLLGLFFALLAMHAVLCHGDRIVAALVTASPLRHEYTRALLDEFRKVGRTTLAGTLLTGVAQGTLAAIGFWITGVPQAVFLGVATALASLVPAVGTLAVWVPAGLYLFYKGHLAPAVIELMWGALVVVIFSDYVIRPRLVGDEAMPALLTFVALLGGFEVLGLPGLVVGPVIMGLAVAVLRLYAREQKTRRAAKA